ncbi:MAG: phosphoribosylformylglycinamidine synthase subunit PurS [Thermomicrobiaceae bacterium]
MSATDQRTSTLWLVEVFVSLKPAVNDPQGLAIRDGLHMLGYHEVDDVRAGKYMQLELSGEDQSQVEARVQEMCEKLLANTVIESYRFDVRPSISDEETAG